MVECTALEMRRRVKPIEGSNPSLSAKSIDTVKVYVDLKALLTKLSYGGNFRFIANDPLSAFKQQSSKARACNIALNDITQLSYFYLTCLLQNQYHI